MVYCWAVSYDPNDADSFLRLYEGLSSTLQQYMNIADTVCTNCVHYSRQHNSEQTLLEVSFVFLSHKGHVLKNAVRLSRMKLEFKLIVKSIYALEATCLLHDKT